MIDNPEMRKAERYAVWLMASTGRIFYKVRSHSFGTRQAAHSWAVRRQPDPRRRMVLADHALE